MRPLAGMTGFSETMLLAVLVWLCVLLLLGHVAVPLLGLKATVGVALGLLAGLLAVCWGICGYRVVRRR